MLVGSLRGFGRFWWDLLVGETPELFAGVVIVVGVVALVAATHSLNALAVAAMPTLVVLVLTGSVGRARRRS